MVSTDIVHLRLSLPDRSYQAMVRSELRKFTESIGFNGHRLAEMEIIIAELTSNLVKHAAKGGFILVARIPGVHLGVEFISIDNGPGMRFSSKMLQDGITTTQTLGQGLGAIKRLSGLFDLFSMAGWGTLVLSRNYLDKEVIPRSNSFEVFGIRVPKKDHLLCGDAWSCRLQGKKIKVALIDGLGHGIHAHDASSLGVQKLSTYSKLDPTGELIALHSELKKTRGAVITITHIDLANHQLMYSGVGNIAMKIITPALTKGCFSYNGIVGHIMPASLNNHNMIWNEKIDTLVMHSDGISTRWDIQKYTNILQHHPIILCAALYKDFDRANDDATILVGKMIGKA